MSSVVGSSSSSRSPWLSSSSSGIGKGGGIPKKIVKRFLIRESCHFGKSSNFEIGVECQNIFILFSARSKRRKNCCANFEVKFTQPFLDLEVPTKYISQQH